jgi:hypothetical protein
MEGGGEEFRIVEGAYSGAFQSILRMACNIIMHICVVMKHIQCQILHSW